jgi:hypothetical protein
VRYRPSSSSNTVLLSASDPLALLDDDALSAEGFGYSQRFGGLHRHAATSSTSLSAYVQTTEFLRQTVSVPRAPGVTIRAVLRTQLAWVDRNRVRVAYQVKDEHDSPIVERPGGVTMSVTFGEPSSSVQSSCNTGHTQSSSQHYIAYCSRDNQLPSSWFATGGGLLLSSLLCPPDCPRQDNPAGARRNADLGALLLCRERHGGHLTRPRWHGNCDR